MQFNGSRGNGNSRVDYDTYNMSGRTINNDNMRRNIDVAFSGENNQRSNNNARYQTGQMATRTGTNSSNYLKRQNGAQQPGETQTAQNRNMALGDVSRYSDRNSPSKGREFIQPSSKKLRNSIVSGILALSLFFCGFIAEKIKNGKKKDDAPQQSAVVESVDETPEETEETEVYVPAVIEKVELNTATPQFGTSRLMIDVTVDKYCLLRIEVVNSAGAVFSTIYDEYEVDEGKQRFYFDGKDGAGNWITVGSYKIVVSVLEGDEITDETSTEESAASAYTVSSSKSADFSVNSNPYRTPVSKPTLVPVPSESAAATETEEPETTETENGGETTPSENPAPSPEAPTPTPAPPSTDEGSGEGGNE